METLIRRALPGDAAGIARIVTDAPWFPHDPEHSPHAGTPTIRETLDTRSDDATTILVAVERTSQELVGYATVHWHPYVMLGGWEGLVAELFVSAAARGNGIGTALLERVRAEAEEHGCVRLSLLNGRDSESYRSGFYRKRGWRERTEIANFVLGLERRPEMPGREREGGRR
ncbi:MAG: GNAT family N-acetyltransferase [Candidatus Bipolaricaulota bacterium]|nr:MAG: GNAT family N-acetyltransferase [Candidatus Bipolaricaulota bacterium]